MAVPEPNERGSDCETLGQVRITRISRARKQKTAKAENHNVTMKHTQRKNLRTSSHKDKVESEGITSKYKVMNCMDKKTGRKNTDLIEMMEVKHVMCQAAQDLNDGETRLESREAAAREHEEVQWTRNASMSDSQAQQPDLTSRGGVLGECVYARCQHHKSTNAAATEYVRSMTVAGVTTSGTEDEDPAQYFGDHEDARGRLMKLMGVRCTLHHASRKHAHTHVAKLSSEKCCCSWAWKFGRNSHWTVLQHVASADAKVWKQYVTCERKFFGDSRW